MLACAQQGGQRRELVFQRVMSRVAEGKGGGFTKRLDDNPEALKIRLREFHDKTRPLLALFDQKGMLVTVDGNQTVEGVFESIVDKLGLPAAVKAG